MKCYPKDGVQNKLTRGEVQVERGGENKGEGNEWEKQAVGMEMMGWEKKKHQEQGRANETDVRQV